MAALAEEEFKIAGKIIASSIVQGGPRSSVGFLSSSVYAYIVNGMVVLVCADAGLHHPHAI